MDAHGAICGRMRTVMKRGSRIEDIMVNVFITSCLSCVLCFSFVIIYYLTDMNNHDDVVIFYQSSLLFTFYFLGFNRLVR